MGKARTPVGSAAKILILAVLMLAAPSPGICGQHSGQRKSMVVTASMYTMQEQETKEGHIGLTAWGDHLKPGMKAIAVSRDLIALGLTHGTRVTIDGFKGIYVVRDKMNRRWKKKIDIFVGTHVAKAQKWGKRKVTIHWTPRSKK